MFVPKNAFGANDRLQVGFVGLGGRARWLLKNEKFPGADIVALADCWRPQCDKAAALLPDGGTVRKYHDYRQMFDEEKLDAVFVETTSHARVLVMMHALQAGLDVYGEKPLTLTVAEGRILAEAVKATNRVLQTGTQQRSMPINAWASKRIREGAIGKVREVITCNFLPPAGWYAKPAQKAPEGMNWDQWCNQCELRPYHEQLRSRWAWYWDYDGGGQSWGVTGWGTHSLDQVQDALGTSHTGPVEFEPESWRSTSKVFARYANGTVLKMVGPERDHADLGAIFVGEKGTIEIKRGSVTASDPELLRGAPDITPEGSGENRFHIANFFDCARSRKQPSADVETGHRSTALCHLVNMTRDLGRKLQWDPERERFAHDDQANGLLARPRRKGYELPRIS
jgi:predicted dehydrogenase